MGAIALPWIFNLRAPPITRSTPARPQARASLGASNLRSPADFDHAFNLAKRITRSNNAKDHFEHHSRFWDGLFGKTQRPILREVFRQLNDRMARYDPLYLKVFPSSERRPR